MKKRLRSRVLALALVGSSLFTAGMVLYAQEKPAASQLLERGSKLYEQKQFEEAKKVLLDINPDQLPEDLRSKRDELLKQADLALAKTAPSSETFDNAKAAQEAGQLSQAAKLYESVIQNANASTEMKQNARIQLELVHATQKQKAPAMKALLNDAVAAYEAGRLDEAQNALYTIESVGTETLDWQDASKPAKYERLIAEKRLALKSPAPAAGATALAAPAVAAAPAPVVEAPAASPKAGESTASTLVATGSEPAAAPQTAPATDTDLLTQTIDAQAIQKQRVQTLYDTYKSAVQDATAAGDYSKAVDQAREAKAQIAANRALFSAQEFQGLTTDSDKLLADAQARAQKAAELKVSQDAKAAADADQRLARDRTKQRNAEIDRLMEQASAAADRQQYGEAINLIDNVLVIEPTNNTAKFLRRQMEDKLTFRNWAKVDTTASREHASQMIENKELMIPYSQLVVYPEDWPELSRHRQGDEAGNDSEANRKTRARLDAQIDSFSADKQGLKQVIDYLVQKTDVNIIPNWKTLATVNVEETTPITLDLHGLSLHKLLTTILDQASGGTVGYTVDEGAITITTKDDLNSAAQEPKISVYDIRDLLIQPDAQAQQPPTFNLASISVDQTTQASSTSAGGGGGGGGGGLFQDNGNQQNQNNSQRRAQLVQDLITTIQFTVSPNSWDTTGGVGSLREHSGQLIVRQTVDNQIKVYNLLQQIREKRDLQIAIEARILLVSNNFLDDFGFGWNLSLPAGMLGPNVGAVTVNNNTNNLAKSPDSGVPGSLGGGNLTTNALDISGQILDNFQLTLLLRATQADKRATTVNAPRVTLFNGQSGYMFVADEQNFVENFSQQTTGTGNGALATTATTLTIRTLPTGMLLAVEAAISSDRRYVIMKLRPQLASLEALDTFVIGGSTTSTAGAVTNVGGPFVQLPRTSFTEVNTMVSVPDGGTLLIGGQKIVGEAEIEVGVPVLSKIPGLNRLFTNRSYTKDERTLLILVRPKIIIPHEEEYKTFGMNYDSGPSGLAPAGAQAAPAGAAR